MISLYSSTWAGWLGMSHRSIGRLSGGAYSVVLYKNYTYKRKKLQWNW